MIARNAIKAIQPVNVALLTACNSLLPRVERNCNINGNDPDHDDDVVLARAAIAAAEKQQAEAGIAIDEAWLRSIGFAGAAFPLEKLTLVLGRTRITFYEGWNIWWQFSTVGQPYVRLIDDMKTRGQLLSLLAALGIDVKEQV